MSAPDFDGGSFRDRRARVFYADGRVLRGLGDAAHADWRTLQDTGFYRRCAERGLVVETRELGSTEAAELTDGHWAAVLEHARIPFVSYPYEWPFSMLKDAARLHLRLLEEALQEGLVLKDSTPYNVQWVGTRPLFIDLPSFEALAPGSPWAGYRQFCELFLYPLMLRAYKGVSFQPWLRGALEGIRPHELRSLISLRDWWRPGVLKHVVMHAAAESRFSDTSLNVKTAMKDAGFSAELIRANVRGLRRVVEKLHVRREKSVWSDYDKCTHYEEADSEAKASFVRRASGARRRDLVWDLGCNIGVFSRIAAESAEYVVAMDADEPTVERLYRELRQEDNDTIHPLTVNLVDPSPDRGWRGLERTRPSRRGRPDLILCLALVHHVVLGSNVHLVDFLDWLAELGGDLIIEFVDKADPMARKLLRNKADEYVDYTPDVFEHALQERFHVEDRLELGSGTRILYHGRNRREP